jgi:hypothetical protein
MWWNHYSWGMSTTSTECKTIVTVMLTVTSGIDPHMISREFWLVQEWFGLVRVGHGVTVVRWRFRFLLELEYTGQIVQLELKIMWGVVQLELKTHCRVVHLELEFLCSAIQLELDVLYRIVQLELDVHCHVVQLELDVYLLNRSIKV